MRPPTLATITPRVKRGYSVSGEASSRAELVSDRWLRQHRSFIESSRVSMLGVTPSGTPSGTPSEDYGITYLLVVDLFCDGKAYWYTHEFYTAQEADEFLKAAMA